MSSQTYVNLTTEALLILSGSWRTIFQYVNGRALLKGLRKHTQAADVEVEIIDIPFRCGTCSVHIYRPAGAKEVLGAVFYLRGEDELEEVPTLMIVSCVI